ncbi:MAG: glycoside hydrolase family 9 protein [Pseudomonadota bacterium]
MPTQVTPSFVDTTTVQLRFELGAIDPGAVTTEIPTDVAINEDGYAFTLEDSTYVGRVRGGSDQFYVPLDTYTPSAIDDLFDWTDANGVRTAAVDDQSRWQVTVNGQAVPITGLSRKANILETANTGWQIDYRTLQNVFLELETPLAPGAQIEVRFDDADFETIAATYAPETTVSEAIHVNLAGYDPDDAGKTAYLSSWNGFAYDADHERGGVGVPQVFTAGMAYDVIDEATGSIVMSGDTTLAQGVEDGTNFWQNYALTDVAQMDLAGLTDPGTYYIVVDGVGRSQSFEVQDDHWFDLFTHTFRGYYHKRSGIELTEEFTDWTRPRALHPDDGITIRETTVKITDTSEAFDGSLPKPFEFWEGNLTGGIVDDAWGGWHDAGDFDRRTQHMQSSRKLTELHEMETEFSEEFDGGIPESGNGIPDLLDEAIWGSMVFRKLQHDDGGVPGGIESASYGSYGDSSFTDQRDLYVYAPDVWTSWEFAATAAKISRALEPYDAVEAAAWLQSGIAAFDWAEANIPTGEGYDNGWLPTSRNLAAAELLISTGDPAYETLFAETFVYGQDDNIEWFENQYEAAYVIANAPDGAVDPELKAQALQVMRDRADWLLENGQNSGFGFITDPYAPYGWGNTASQPTNSADFLIRMHALTGEAKYLEPVAQDVDYALGANPMNMTFITGMDRLVEDIRQPLTILDADSDVLGGDPAPGITLYGELNVLDYGWGGWHSEMWEETWPNYYDAPVHESWNAAYGFVPVTEFTVMQGMEDMTFVTGYLAAQEGPSTSQVTVTDDDNSEPWASYIDTFDAQGGLILRSILNDDGRRFEIGFEDGLVSNRTTIDAAGTYNWESVSDRFGSDGARTEREIVFDSGLITRTGYQEGAITSKTTIDGAGTYSWSSQTKSYDGTGTLIARDLINDDGRVLAYVYVDGALSTLTLTDAPDTRNWDNIFQTFNTNGAMTAQDLSYDDGRLLETVYQDGVRRSETMTDRADAYSWAHYDSIYDAAGLITERTTVYDSGTIRVVTYEDGVPIA